MLSRPQSDLPPEGLVPAMPRVGQWMEVAPRDEGLVGSWYECCVTKVGRAKASVRYVAFAVGDCGSCGAC